MSSERTTGPGRRAVAVRSAVVSSACLLAGGCGATFTGVVYADRNRDGVQQTDEPGVPGVVVAVDRAGFVTTDANGRYRVELATSGDIVWARPPDGFRPGPAWTRATGDQSDIGLAPLTDAERARPLAFVVAADSHTPDATTENPWDGGDLVDAIDQATSLPEPPRFFTIVGDITQGGSASQLDRVGQAFEAIAVPWVPVPGNHDWYDGGTAYRARFGPDNYSFDVDELHVVVWDTNLSNDEQLAFFAADLASVPRGTTVIALGHHSPDDDVADRLVGLGVDYVFTGHWHANRRVARTGLVEWGTQTFVMGGIDQSPSGYRVVTFDHGVPTVVHRERMIAPHLGLGWPHAGSCASPNGFAILAAAALDAAVPRVSARLDCGPAVTLAPAGGWTFRSDAAALATGRHTLDLRAVSPSGREVETRVAFTVCDPPRGPSGPASWPQLGGGPEHVGSTSAVVAPPLQVAWATAIGGTLALGSPVIAGDTIVVAQTDRGPGDTGGLVALDLATGAVRWRATTPFPVTAAPAIDGDIVVATLGDGEVRAFALADGHPRWTHALGTGIAIKASSLWAPPLIADRRVYVGVQGRFDALDLATGDPVWRRDQRPVYPWLGSLAAPALAGDAVLAAFGRDGGATAWATEAGDQRWRVETSATLAINATPIVVGDIAYVASAYGTVAALDVATGTQRWARSITPGGFDWGYSITAAPAYAAGRLFVPTQWRDLVALDAATGSELWRVATPGGPLETAHYRSAQPGFAASPLVAGDTVWIGRPDGTLVALAAADGHELWSTQLGAPVLSAPVPADQGALIVATYDGIVRALVPGAITAPLPGPACPAALVEPAQEVAELGGCCQTGGGAGSLTLALAVALRLRRRRACAPGRTVHGSAPR